MCVCVCVCVRARARMCVIISSGSICVWEREREYCLSHSNAEGEPAAEEVIYTYIHIHTYIHSYFDIYIYIHTHTYKKSLVLRLAKSLRLISTVSMVFCANLKLGNRWNESLSLGMSHFVSHTHTNISHIAHIYMQKPATRCMLHELKPYGLILL